MKKITAMILAMVMVLSLAACGGKDAGNSASQETKKLEGTMEELVNKVIEAQPVEFMGGIMPVDLGDTSEDGKWALSYFTGLQDASAITDVAVYEPMMGSQAFSLVMVRTVEGADPKAVAEEMKAGIDPRKWICVQADQVMLAGYGDVVMFIMLDSALGKTAQSYVDAFEKVCGSKPDFTL